MERTNFSWRASIVSLLASDVHESLDIFRVPTRVYIYTLWLSFLCAIPADIT